MSGSAYGASMELCRRIKAGETDPAEIERLWHEVFDMVLGIWGFTRKAKDAMWAGLVAGNWERLHATPVEELLPASVWLEALCSDVFYFSDRWSLDRLCRAHWTWRRYEKAAGQGADE